MNTEFAGPMLPKMNKEAVLAKILMWAFHNDIEISMSSFSKEGYKKQIQMDLIKNGRREYIRLYDFEELTLNQIQNLIEQQAFKLCLTRLIL